MTEIPKLEQFKTSYASLKERVPEVVEKELRFIVMSDFYDGLLEGIVEYSARKYWYKIVSDFINERTRYFALVALSDEEYEMELYWHRRFEDYISQGLTEEKLLEWEKIYGAYRKNQQSNYEDKEVAAWFQMY